jgi:hypothetical protein
MSDFQFTKRTKEPHLRGPSFSVGRRAIVTHERARILGVHAVVLTDESGTTTLQALADGQEVEMLEWRLAWRQGPQMLYRVCCLGNGALGWVRAELLRGTHEGASGRLRSLATAPRRAPAADSGRARSRVGTRPLPETPRAPERAAGPARTEQPVACAVCKREVHPYNLWTDSKGASIGCYLCKGKQQ